jgi:hypothetical protein
MARCNCRQQLSHADLTAHLVVGRHAIVNDPVCVKLRHLPPRSALDVRVVSTNALMNEWHFPMPVIIRQH